MYEIMLVLFVIMLCVMVVDEVLELDIEIELIELMLLLVVDELEVNEENH